MTTVFQENCSFEDNGPDCTSVVGGGIFLKISRTAHDNHPVKRSNWGQEMNSVGLRFEEKKDIVLLWVVGL